MQKFWKRRLIRNTVPSATSKASATWEGSVPGTAFEGVWGGPVSMATPRNLTH